MFANLPSPAVIAHRGASAFAPENTLSAFRLAIQQEADAIEMDVKLSADGHVVVFHDPTVDRTTNGTGRVRALPLAALKELDAGIIYDAAFEGERIPTLDEVFTSLKDQIVLNIELKSRALNVDPLAQKVAQIVKKHQIAAQLFFSSFNPLALRRIHNLLPDVPLGVLAPQGLLGIWIRTWSSALIPHQSLHLYYKNINQNLIDQAHRQGRRVFAYTVNNPQDIKELINLGIDGIFTDDPSLARRTIEKTR
jgi:glycerophosphoryl diester phosphodiesterase